MSTFVHSVSLMDTVVTFRVPLFGRAPADARAYVERAVAWFRDVEAAEAAGFNRWDSGKSQRGK